MKPTKTLSERRTETDSNENVVASVEFMIRADLHNSVETDFVHSILGRITAEPESGRKEDAGHIGASLVQFGEALDHGISAERLGDGISGDISEYWEQLFDVETGYPKEEIQNEFEVVDLDLLIIDYVAIYPEYRGLGIAESVIHRTIDIFGAGCGLVACKPWPLQVTMSAADDQEAVKRLALPNVSKGEALRKLRSYWSRLGFWPLGKTGIYLLSLSQRACDVSSRGCGKSIQ
jgi:GNAT superfamily N-acetyltransferase